ncbi:MAG: XisH family protein [Cyanobacteria bacterium J06649_4]
MARDIFHDAVKRALEKERWVITADPLQIKFGDIKFQVDLAAERILAAHRDDEKIAVEIKSFLNPSAITDFYAALGQFLSYRLALSSTDPRRMLYLAVPSDAYETFFQLAFSQAATKQYQIKLMVYDPAREEIVR